VVAAEYQDLYGEHAYDAEGNYIGPDYAAEEAPAHAPEASAEATDGETATEGEPAPEGDAAAAAPVEDTPEA
jgi:hypothetical protein